MDLAHHRPVRALLGEGADMGFAQDRLLPRPSPPVDGAPAIGAVIDHLAWTGHIIGLKRGSRIGDIDLAVDAELITRTGLDAGNLRREPAVASVTQRGWSFQEHLDMLGRRRPQTKGRTGWGQLWAKLPLIHAEPAKASTERGGAFRSAPEAKSAVFCSVSVVLSTCCQLLYSCILGNLKAISSGAAFRTIKIGICPGSIGPST